MHQFISQRLTSTGISIYPCLYVFLSNGFPGLCFIYRMSAGLCFIYRMSAHYYIGSSTQQRIQKLFTRNENVYVSTHVISSSKKIEYSMFPLRFSDSKETNRAELLSAVEPTTHRLNWFSWALWLLKYPLPPICSHLLSSPSPLNSLLIRSWTNLNEFSVVASLLQPLFAYNIHSMIFPP